MTEERERELEAEVARLKRLVLAWKRRYGRYRNTVSRVYETRVDC